MNGRWPPEAVNALLALLHELQRGCLALWQALGLGTPLHGQPAWPWAWRLAGEMLVLDAGHLRRVVLTLACLLLAALLLGLSAFWRRARKPLWGIALALLLLAPWPDAGLLWAPAVPTSLHASPTGFTAQGIARGAGVYRQHCVRCHGEDGRGEGPDAASLPMWPPTLNGALLWKRLDGELFWRVRHGLQARDGQRTMPGFADRLSDTQVWEVLDYLQAHAAGRMLQQGGAWNVPVRVPDTGLRCRGGRQHTARSLQAQGQRLLLVLPGPGAALPAEDPRLVTVQVGPGAGTDPECRTDDPDMPAALALLLGVGLGEGPGHQVLVDRAGWLRARSRPGQPGWSDSDLVCRSTTSPTALAPAPAGDGLGSLIRRMDAEPVQLVRGGFPH
ncbi:MAG: cytochrome c [Burkholderiaceae bacterium]|nr:cytochrome c [Burkholderiaceae bacterium]